jgi:hypothetical protein
MTTRYKGAAPWYAEYCECTRDQSEHAYQVSGDQGQTWIDLVGDEPWGLGPGWWVREAE